MRNLSIGALVTMILGLAAGVGTTASAAPIGNLAGRHARRSARTILSCSRRAEAGTAAAQFIVDARFIAASPYTVERRSAVGESSIAAAAPTDLTLLRLLSLPAMLGGYSGGGAVYRGGTVYRGRTVHRGATVHRGGRAHVSHHRGGGRRR